MTLAAAPPVTTPVLLPRVITDAIKPDADPGLIALVTTREGVDDLLKLDDCIDLVRAKPWALRGPAGQNRPLGMGHARAESGAGKSSSCHARRRHRRCRCCQLPPLLPHWPLAPYGCSLPPGAR